MKKNYSAKKSNVTPYNIAKKLAEKRAIRRADAPYVGHYYTVEGAAYSLNCSTRRVRQLLQANRLLGYKIGKNWRVKWPFLFQVGTRGPVSSAINRPVRGSRSEAY
jgi:excisionase family DNA binding protein